MNGTDPIACTCLINLFRFCHSPVDILASARAAVSGSGNREAQEGARIGAGVGTDRRGSEHGQARE